MKDLHLRRKIIVQCLSTSYNTYIKWTKTDLKTKQRKKKSFCFGDLNFYNKGGA